MRVLTVISVLILIAGCSASNASADSSHVRIVRLSLVQGDVRFARDVKGDPLADLNAGWEAAVLNLPIRQGYTLATDNGRAVVEFENGAMAFLSENTVLQFYDLSSEDGGFTTRLVLRQGSAEFYVNPARGDYFSVTGGDFSVQAEARTTFRMNNFDDGSSVNVLRGRLTAVSKGKSTPLQKNQELSIKAGDPDSLEVQAAPGSDDFDQWVSGRIQSFSTATASGAQYANSYDSYDYGLGDLYTYGTWFSVPGYGNCWRPYGVGFGWSPFDSGSWFYDGAFGWSFLGGQPWGWLPYHYGGWLFRPGVGWVWNPSGSFGGDGLGRWRPVTGVWMRSAGGSVAIVPSHPQDRKGKTPLNLSAGLFAVTQRGVSNTVPLESNDRWKTQKSPPRDVMQSQLARVTAPARVVRTMAASTTGSSRVTTGSGGAAIVYDRAERRFVNAGIEPSAKQGTAVRVSPEQNGSGSVASHVPPVPERVSGREGQRAANPSARAAMPPRATVTPPSVPRSVSAQRAFNGYNGGGSGASRGGTSSAGGSSSRGASSSSRGASGASSGASSAAGSRASGGASSSGGGGRPH